MSTQPTSASNADEMYEEIATEGGMFEMRRAAAVLAARKIEGLKLYEPLLVQDHFRISMAKERVLRGSNRSGKTLAAAAAVAEAVCGLDPFGRYPARDGIGYCVGFDGRHIADPMWKKLSKAGAFKMIRDLHTNKWRAFRPWQQSDAMRKNDAKPAPPLIPPRMIESISWELKKENQPKIVKLKTGWEIHFYSGNAKPPQGSECNLAWFDEELSDGEWYPEIAARLLTSNGYFIWSATPQAGTDRLFELHERAEREAEQNRQPRTVEEFVLLSDNNLHIDEEQKQAFYEKLSDEDRDIRVSGEFARIHRVYPEYNAKFHEIPFREIPLDWTRYVAVDPGYQVTAALFCAIPPPIVDEGKRVYIYDEIHIKNCSAVQFGEAMAVKCAHQDFYEFLMDPHQGPKHEQGSGMTVEQQFSAQLRLRGIRSFVNGSGFTLAEMSIEPGLEAMRAWLRRTGPMTNSEPGTRYSVLQIIADRCPNLIWELKRYKFKRIKGVVQNQPEQKNCDGIDCLRYLAMAKPVWSQRARGGMSDPPAYAAFRKFMKNHNQPSGGILLGPGNSFR